LKNEIINISFLRFIINWGCCNANMFGKNIIYIQVNFAIQKKQQVVIYV